MKRFLSVLAGTIMISLAGHAVAGTPAAKPSSLDQRAATMTAEVAKLKQDVAAEEDKSRQTDQRLQEQDKTIADLQKQLNALKAAPATQGKHP